MSTDTERVEEGTETSLLESWRDWYHLPVLGVVMLFMLWVRTQAYERFVEDGTPAFAGIDSWYHWRTINWTAENYPHTMPYEVWTGFPTGTYVGQFGTLYDQLIVTVAMIVGFGDPSQQTLYTVSLLAVPVMAALVAIPVFYAGRRLGGTLGGLVSVLVIALSTGQFLSRSTVGQLDHQAVEPLFMAIAVVAMMVAVTAGEREKPIYELVVDRDWTTLRTPVIYSVLAGVALTLYIWVWPSGVLLVGIFGVFFAIQLTLDYVRGSSPDHIAFVGAVSLGVTAVLTTLLIEQPGSTGSTSLGLLQPLLAFLVAAGCVFMAWLAREWNDRGLGRRYYPAAIGGLIAATLLVMWLALPSLFDSIVGNATRRMIPIGGTATDLTIVEAQPPENFFNRVFAEFGSAFYTMLAGLAFLAIRPLFGRKFRAEHTLVIVWSLFLISMAATQVRFMYYLVLAVAIVNAAFVAELVQLFNLDLKSGLNSIKSLETYQVVAVVLVVLLLFAPLLPPLAQAGGTAWEVGEATGPNSDATTWEASNEWLQENTPAPGNYGGADNADQLDYYGTYTPGDGDFEYPEGAYGVMSWWDYGHLITTQAERIPHSNPFQQNARSSSAFLTAESEDHGELILEGIAAGEPVAGRSTEDLQQTVSGDNSDEEIRYVMIDYAMAGGKFGAITQWTGPGYGHYVTPEDYSGQPISADEVGQVFGDLPYDDTMTSKLYFDDAEDMEHYRLVHENTDPGMAFFVSYAQVSDGQVVHIGENGQPVQPGQGQPAVVVNRRVSQQTLLQLRSSPNYQVFDAKSAAAVKTFERVEGATITGTVGDGVSNADNATAAATVELETNSGRTFNYTQRADLAADGSFELTVPYATNDELGVEDGYTNSSVEATGNYTVSVVATGDGEPTYYSGETAVSEPAVVDGDSVDVSLEEVTTRPSGVTDGTETNDGSTDTESTDASGNETEAPPTNALAPVTAEPAL
ncbi:oligosaccharyl transferase, archaeosortase A system-associated [Natrinema hispanicum]|uniref:dolichyl-phosphooligosaccharide-protein glycotransferase n=1 Tax=Natrinema hispanicum TaxID=392421 RepID=A0A1G6TWE1_9EURY|nr:oligosaccharyl transferase, archaeosortase A system-associated [Natrinema hispanicum]SDD33361.1 dolichyl-diphosphooligosaccharide--protein glycosyltransferase [Natrinema hispanicum]SET93278.1 dolichyl-diphosphooligosaccharide--protein glycosyltransferase [Natrinema hispanicum]